MERPKITHILVVDHAGSGWNLLWTTDQVTWVCFRKRPQGNRHLIEGFCQVLLDRDPDAQVRRINDFYGRIPEDWLLPGARVI